MKSRFNSFDIVCGITELQKILGLRVNQIYDVSNKTYLIRLQAAEEKSVLLLESGIRFHTTDFEWPKNSSPSGFTMKLRKHLKNKRLEKVEQLGVDRIVNFQFGTKEAAYHLFLELYDRGNIVLTDYEYTILYVLRPHCEGEEIRFAVREKYPLQRAKQISEDITIENLRLFLSSCTPEEYLRRALMNILYCGPAVIEHVLIQHDLNECVIKGEKYTDNNEEQPQEKLKRKLKKVSSVKCRFFNESKDMENLLKAIQESNDILNEAKNYVSKGYVIQRKADKTNEKSEKDFYLNIEYHPFPFVQYKNQPCSVFGTFLQAVDEFYSKQEEQKIDIKTIQKERDAIKKLSNVKKDHTIRLQELSKTQEVDKQKAELITTNQELVDNAILAIRSSIANQMSWTDIRELVKAAQLKADPVAIAINQLMLEINKISLKLKPGIFSGDQNNELKKEEESAKYTIVEVDLGLTAFANARKYYDQKRMAAKKEQKTIDASERALKNAERKTQQTLKDVRIISNISKARKVYWFEKFYWFISSENYLVIGGRDAQQNELIVKRYMRQTDIYVHAEIQGASSVVIRNPSGKEVLPKTLLEAGTMAISYSVAWDAKVVTNVFWVNSDQVSKKAPTGEYLGTGSFMIRGKKNFLPSCNLVMGLSLLFKLEDGYIEKHRGERKARIYTEENKNDAEEINPLLKNQVQNDKNVLKQTKQPDIVFDTREGECETMALFPNTEVKIKHDLSCIPSCSNLAKCNSPVGLDSSIKVFVEEDATILSAAPTRKKLQSNSKKKKESNERKNEEKKIIINENILKSINPSKPKRGQQKKIKKLNSKYKDQDDEERLLRLKLLKSFGNCEEPLKTQTIEPPVVKNVSYNEKNKIINNENEDNYGELVVDVPEADVEVIDSLTGQPLEDDELLFVIPVVAPYQALQNYKYKIKIVPGTGKRGKAAKSSLMIFSKDKLCTQRERDLLKSIKEDLFARNIPGKVKIAATHLSKLKK